MQNSLIPQNRDPHFSHSQLVFDQTMMHQQQQQHLYPYYQAPTALYSAVVPQRDNSHNVHFQSGGYRCAPHYGGHQQSVPSRITPHGNARNDADDASLYTNLCVSKIPLYMTDDSLESAFLSIFPGRQMGDVVISAKIMRDVVSGTSKGYGFVLFKHPCDADYARAHPPTVPDVDLQKIQRKRARKGLGGVTPDELRTVAMLRLSVQAAKHSGHNAGVMSKADSNATGGKVYIGNIPFFATPLRVEKFFKDIAYQIGSARNVDSSVLSVLVRYDDPADPDVRKSGKVNRGKRSNTDPHKESYHRHFVDLWESGMSPGNGERGAKPENISFRFVQEGATLPPSYMMFIEFKEAKIAQDIIIRLHGKQPFTLEHNYEYSGFSPSILSLALSTGMYPVVEFPEGPDHGRVVLVPQLSSWLRIPSFLKFRPTNFMRLNYNDSSSDEEEGRGRDLTRKIAVPPLFVKAAENKERRDERMRAPHRLTETSKQTQEVDTDLFQSFHAHAVNLETHRATEPNSNPVILAANASVTLPSVFDPSCPVTTIFRNEIVSVPMICAIVEGDPEESLGPHLSTSQKSKDVFEESSSTKGHAGSFGSAESADGLISMFLRKSAQIVVEHSTQTGRQTIYFQCTETNKKVLIGSSDSPLSVLVTFDRKESSVRARIMKEERDELNVILNSLPQSTRDLVVDQQMPCAFDGSTTAFGGEIVRNNVVSVDIAEGVHQATPDVLMNATLMRLKPQISESGGCVDVGRGSCIFATSAKENSLAGRESMIDMTGTFGCSNIPQRGNISFVSSAQGQAMDEKQPATPPHATSPFMSVQQPAPYYQHQGSYGCATRSREFDFQVPSRPQAFQVPPPAYVQQRSSDAFANYASGAVPLVVDARLPLMHPVNPSRVHGNSGAANSMGASSLSSAAANPSSSVQYFVASKSAADFNGANGH